MLVSRPSRLLTLYAALSQTNGFHTVLQSFARTGIPDVQEAALELLFVLAFDSGASHKYCTHAHYHGYKYSRFRTQAYTLTKTRLTPL